jgi:lipopolysaccharide assembly outer membrane protein LptD (OstA)
MKVLEKQRSEYNSFACAVPQASVVWKWPLLMKSSLLETIFTPIVGIIAAGNKKYFDIFEDQFCEINDINFLEGSRALSPYNIDHGSRICYGAKTSVHMNGRNLLYFTIGRSTELTILEKKLEATGMKNKNSNIVTSMDAFLSDKITFTMKGSYSTKTQRWLKCESGLKFSNEIFDADLMIFNGKQCNYNPFLANTDVVSDEEKIQKYSGFMVDIGWKTSQTVKLMAGVIFGNEGSKLIKHRFGIEYKNECTQLGISIERTNYRSGDVKPDTSLKLVVHLKNLGI